MSNYFVLCEADKLNIEKQLEGFYNSITNRLLPSFLLIEKEADQVEKESLNKRSKAFNPDTMDEASIIEDAYFDGINHYLVEKQMKQAFVNVATLWLYHLFEQQLNNISLKVIDCFDYTKSKPKTPIQRIKDCLKEKELDNNLHWKKINEELRFVANTLKHADGSSKKQLEQKRPDLFEQIGSKMNDIAIPLFENEICVSELDFNDYYNAIVGFWTDYFHKIPVMERTTKCQG
ncbi:MAG: hypothetical protein RBR97_20825 [Bacteroidales bacterium]|nr:hypothetical protein [Bacteroidales bacterium]